MLLAAPGIDVNVCDKYGQNALHAACVVPDADVHREKCIEQLLKAPGIDINFDASAAPLANTTTPLHSLVTNACSTELPLDAVRLMLADPRIDIHAGNGRAFFDAVMMAIHLIL